MYVASGQKKYKAAKAERELNKGAGSVFPLSPCGRGCRSRARARLRRVRGETQPPHPALASARATLSHEGRGSSASFCAGVSFFRPPLFFFGFGLFQGGRADLVKLLAPAAN
jgi:hypothetical protein